MLREHFPSLEPEREEDLWNGEREAPTQQIPKRVCKRLQVGDVTTQVVLIFLSRSVLLGPKAELRTCNTVCILTFSDVLSKESFLSAVILHLLPIALSHSLFNRRTADPAPSADTECRVVSAVDSFSSYGLSLRSLKFWQVHQDVSDLLLFLTPSDLLMSPSYGHHYGDLWWPFSCSYTFSRA